MLDYSLQRAKSKDCKQVISIREQGDVFNYPKFFYRFLAFFGLLYVARVDNRIIGYICYAILPPINKAFLIQISILPEFRGKGLGGKMLDDICEEINSKHGIDDFLAHTLKPKVVKLFQRKSWNIVADILGVVFIKKSSRS